MPSLLSQIDPSFTVQNESSRNRLRFSAFIGVAAIIAICCFIIYSAEHKLFWLDEGIEVLESCNQPYSSILLDGPANQCSPAPLYYILQKFVLSRATISEGILVSFRTVSIGSAVLTLLVLLFGFARHPGLSWGLLSLMVVTFGTQFGRFAAENRPYMLWVFLFTASLILTSSLAYRRWNEIGLGLKALLGLLLLALSLVAGGGMIQAIGFLAILSIWPQSLDIRKWTRGFAFKFQLAVACATTGAGFYYALKACTNYNGPGRSWDLLRTGDWQLLRHVIDVLWYSQLPSCGSRTDPCGVITAGFNLSMIVAAVLPFVVWKNRSQLTETGRFILSVSVASLVQIACAVIIGILVARAHYFFIPRIFIFLIVLRTALTVCGGYLLVMWLSEKLGKRFSFMRGERLQRLVLAGIVLGLSNSLYFPYRYARQEAAAGDGLTLIDNTCPPARSLALIDAEAPSEEYKLNFIVAFDRRLRACGWKPADGPAFYVAPQYFDERTYGYKISSTLAPGSSILTFFRHPLLGRTSEVQR
jgi:hypothetical protein